MKRGLKFFIFSLLLFIIVISFLLLINIQEVIRINGEIIGNLTGKASSQITNVAITILSGLNLSIVSPNNETYLNNFSIFLNYSVDGEQSVWYNLDSGTNTSLTSPVFFSTSDGQHILYLYANDSGGELMTRNISFYLNSTLFIIIDDEFSGASKGISTNFTILSYNEIQNLSSINLENSNFGKILFNQNVNITEDFDFSDSLADLDSNVNISFNRIQLNSTALPNFNVLTTLWLYNLTFSNPRILKDGAVCSDSVCTKESYSGGTLKFNVTGFSIYSAEETPETVTPGSGGSGGGGGGGAAKLAVKVLSVNKKEIKASLIPGSVSTEKIKITNNLDKAITLKLEETSSIKPFLSIEEKQIELASKESREVLIDFKVRENILPDLYVGKILIKGEGVEEEVLVVLEVESEGALLDVKVDILKEFLNIYNTREIVAEIKIFNVGEPGNRKDVNIHYILKDVDGNELITEEETVSLETQTSWIKRLTLPKSIPGGQYLLYVQTITYEGKIASASASFEIIKIGIDRVYLLLILIFITLLGIIFFLVKQKKKANSKLNRLPIGAILKKRR